ncbi:hypothetical protein [Paenibacillus sp. HB172176]|uniref:hypothetical protein n=1 Tax=Paenibacillus sp. HB172176 TaxID=2493690 RepID=UPI00143B601B|nr:hypothetical protein [Paenibacillus sp. HB172176]
MRRAKSKKSKWKKILIWTAAVIVVLGVGGLFAANYAVNKLISSLSESLEAETLDATIAEATAPPTSEEPPASGMAEPDASPVVEGPSSTPKPSSSSASEPSATEGYTAEISTDKAKEVEDEITVGEKAKVTKVLLSELSLEDIKNLQKLAGGGLSKDEKKEARDLILEKLSPEQYDELIQIAKKYGLSQGKSYDEVSKEK